MNRSGPFVASGALRMKVALLPAGHDPDTFLRAEGAAAFGERIATARSLLSYALDRVLADGPGPLVPGRGPANAFARAALMLAKVPDAQEAASLSHEAGRKLGVDPTQLWTESRKLAAALNRPVVGTRPAVARRHRCPRRLAPPPRRYAASGNSLASRRATRHFLTRQDGRLT